LAFYFDVLLVVYIYIVIHLKYPSLTKSEFSRQIFEKFSNIKFYENPSGLSRIALCRQTEWQADFNFRNFSNAPEEWLHFRCVSNKAVIKLLKL